MYVCMHACMHACIFVCIYVKVMKTAEEDEDECSFPVIGGGCATNMDELPLMKGQIRNREITVRRDSGSTGIMVKARLVDPSQLIGIYRRPIMVNSRYVIEAYVARIYIDTPVFTGEVLALCFTESICDLVIGNIPGVYWGILRRLQRRR